MLKLVHYLRNDGSVDNFRLFFSDDREAFSELFDEFTVDQNLAKLGNPDKFISHLVVQDVQFRGKLVRLAKELENSTEKKLLFETLLDF
jgi:hypothetical protein